MTITILLIQFITINGQTVYRDSIAPKIEFTDWIGNPNGTSVINDKPIVLEFWSTWCGPCIKAIPHFNKLTEKYSKDITFISVNSYEAKEIVTKFLNKNHMSSFVALDEDQSLKTAFNIQNIPVTIIIDKNRMLRWRGITSQLTDEVINTFITKNEFKDTYKKGGILNQEFSVELLENVNYQLEIEYGDATLGKGISTNSKGEFYLKLSNYSIYAILNTFSDWFKLEDNWKFEGNLPEKDVITLSVKSSVELNDEADVNKLLNDVILRLSESFNFEIIPKEEMHTIWYIIPDTIQLEKHLSENQELDVEAVEKTEEYTKYKNLFFEYLASSLSIRTKQKIKYQSIVAPQKYDLKIQKSSDINEVKIHLKENYGIDLIKKEETAKVKIATFY